MLIQIPVLIAFDCADAGYPSPLARAAGQCVFTLRYDTDPAANVEAQFCSHYPPRANATWMTDSEGVFFEVLASATDRTIRDRATDNPESYVFEETV